jgi:hypothetical protein
MRKWASGARGDDGFALATADPLGTQPNNAVLLEEVSRGRHRPLPEYREARSR